MYAREGNEWKCELQSRLLIVNFLDIEFFKKQNRKMNIEKFSYISFIIKNERDSRFLDYRQIVNSFIIEVLQSESNESITF